MDFFSWFPNHSNKKKCFHHYFSALWCNYYYFVRWMSKWYEWEEAEKEEWNKARLKSWDNDSKILLDLEDQQNIDTHTHTHTSKMMGMTMKMNIWNSAHLGDGQIESVRLSYRMCEFIYNFLFSSLTISTEGMANHIGIIDRYFEHSLNIIWCWFHV